MEQKTEIKSTENLGGVEKLDTNSNETTLRPASLGNELHIEASSPQDSEEYVSPTAQENGDERLATPSSDEPPSPTRVVPSIPASGLPTMIPMSGQDSTSSAQSASASRPKVNRAGNGNKKSYVWKYFSHPLAEDGTPDRTHTKCTLCVTELAFNASGTTTTMLNHLKSRHTSTAEMEEAMMSKRKLSKGASPRAPTKPKASNQRTSTPVSTNGSSTGPPMTTPRRKHEAILQNIIKTENPQEHNPLALENLVNGAKSVMAHQESASTPSPPTPMSMNFVNGAMELPWLLGAAAANIQMAHQHNYAVPTQDKRPKSPGKRKRKIPMHLPIDATIPKRERMEPNDLSAPPAHMRMDWFGPAALKVEPQNHRIPTSDSIRGSITHMRECLAYFLVRDLQPLGMLEGAGFQMLIRQMLPGMPLPTVDKMRGEIMPGIYDQVNLKVMTEFQHPDINGAALSMEIWDRDNLHYASIKLHFLDAQMGTLKSKLLTTTEINAQVLCSKLLLDHCSKFGISDITRGCPVVVNNPEPLNDELANADVMDSTEQFVVIPCLYSCLSDAIKAGFNLRDVSNLVARCRGLDPSMGTESGPIYEDKGWHAALVLLRRVHACYGELKQQYRDSVSYSDMLLNLEEEALLEKLIPVIENIKQTLETIDNGSLFMTASMIKPILCNLRKNQLCIHNGGPGSTAQTIVSRFKEAVWEHLRNCYPETGRLNDALWLATLVDPRFKRCYESHLVGYEEQMRIVRLLEVEVGEADGCDPGHTDDADLRHVFGNFSLSQSSEVGRYLLDSPIQIKENPIQWWASNRRQFPGVATVARRYLCIPVTSVPTNQLYQVEEGLVDSTPFHSKRANLDPKDLDVYLFLAHNWEWQ